MSSVFFIVLGLIWSAFGLEDNTEPLPPISHFPELRNLPFNKTVYYKEDEPMEIIYLKFNNEKDSIDMINLGSFRRQLYNEFDYVPKNHKHYLKSEATLKKEFNERSKIASVLRREHAKKVVDLAVFMNKYPKSVNYFYDAIVRLRNPKTVRDALRNLVDYVETTDPCKVKGKLLHCVNSLYIKLCRPTNLLGNLPMNEMRVDHVEGN
nr:uncharacterized protein LOC128681176 isoform X1 [Plodia interpunctella]